MSLIEGESIGVVLGYNCQSRIDPDVYESLQVRLMDFDKQPEVEATEPLPKWQFIGRPKLNASKYPIGSEVCIKYKYSQEYNEFASVKIVENFSL